MIAKIRVWQLKGISSINDISIINIEGSGMVGKAGFSGRLFSLLAREQINVILITQSSSEHSITFAIHPSDAARAQHLIEHEFELELLAKRSRHLFLSRVFRCSPSSEKT
jgi:aspartokinase/homoserine dehydrogenase 1